MIGPETIASGSVPPLSVPGYRIVRRVGAGGFATVYEAVQEDVDAPVALKVLMVDPSDPRLRERFERECRTMGRLRDQRGVVPVYQSAFASDGRPVIVMAYMPGGTLADQLRDHGPLPAEDVIQIGITIAGALRAAHELGIFHRDIKPENILVDRDGQPALSDLGIASVDGLLIGTKTEASLTPPHAPPERFVDAGTSNLVAGDVYSLGSTLYELLAGDPPFGTASDGGIAALIQRVLDDPPPPIDRPDVTPELTAALAAALTKDPGERPSPADLAQLLTAASAGRVDDAQPLRGPASTADRMPVPIDPPDRAEPEEGVGTDRSDLTRIVTGTPATGLGGPDRPPPTMSIAPGRADATADATIIRRTSDTPTPPTDLERSDGARRRNRKTVVRASMIIVAIIVMVIGIGTLLVATSNGPSGRTEAAPEVPVTTPPTTPATTAAVPAALLERIDSNVAEWCRAYWTTYSTTRPAANATGSVVAAYYAGLQNSLSQLARNVAALADPTSQLSGAILDTSAIVNRIGAGYGAIGTLASRTGATVDGVLQLPDGQTTYSQLLTDTVALGSVLRGHDLSKSVTACKV